MIATLCALSLSFSPALPSGQPVCALAQDAAPQKDAQKEKVEWVKEPDTGVLFKEKVTSKQHDKTLTLAGVAVRDKRFVILVNVYAYALYIDESVATKRLTQYHGATRKSLDGNRRFLKNLWDDTITRTLAMQFVRDVDAKKVRDAFADSLEPRIKHAAEIFKWTDGEKALETFRSYFKTELKLGQKIEFTWLPGHRVATSVSGKHMGIIESKALSWALWDVYFGKDPIEKKGQVSCVARFADRLGKLPKFVKKAKKKAKEQEPAPTGD